MRQGAAQSAEEPMQTPNNALLRLCAFVAGSVLSLVHTDWFLLHSKQVLAYVAYPRRVLLHAVEHELDVETVELQQP